MVDEILNQISDNAGVYAVIFVIQAGLYASVFVKFEAPYKEGLKAAFWSTFSVMFFWESVQSSDKAGWDAWPLAGMLIVSVLLFLIAFFMVAYFVERPIERDLVEPGKEREIYGLPTGVPYVLSIPVANWPLSLFILVAPRRWMTGASAVIKTETPEWHHQIANGADVVILPKVSSLILVASVILSVSGLLFYIASDEGATLYEATGGYGGAGLLIIAMTWRVLPNGNKLLILNKDGFSVPQFLTLSRNMTPWSNVKKTEPSRTGLVVHLHNAKGKRNPFLVPLMGNDPKLVADLMARYVEQQD